MSIFVLVYSLFSRLPTLCTPALNLQPKINVLTGHKRVDLWRHIFPDSCWVKRCDINEFGLLFLPPNCVDLIGIDMEHILYHLCCLGCPIQLNQD
jgi:hypothetical protein